MDSNGQLPPIILTRKKKEDPFSELLRRAELGKRIGRGSEVTGLISVGASKRGKEDNVASGGSCSDVVVLPSDTHRGAEKNRLSLNQEKTYDANKTTLVQLQGFNGSHSDSGLNIPWRQQQGAQLPKMDGKIGGGTEGSTMRGNELKLDPRSFMAHDLELLSPMHASGRMVPSDNRDSVKYSKSGRELSSPGAFWQTEQAAFEKAGSKQKKESGAKRKTGKKGRSTKAVKDMTLSTVIVPENKRTSVASLAAAAGVKAAEMSVLRTESVGKMSEITEARSPKPEGLSSVKTGKPQKKQISKRNTNAKTPKNKIPKGVPDHIMAEIAATPPGSRPKRCGYCKSCLNPARKKACEVIRALGTNPPIPRGQNRIILLGEDAKRTISKGDACLNKIQEQQHKADLAPSTTGIHEKKRKVERNQKAKEISEKKRKENKARSTSKKSKKILKKKATENKNPTTNERKKPTLAPKDGKNQRSQTNRCGQCKACLNPSRKKACESIRAMGINPPIPRGKNRIAILGEEAAKMTISKSSFSPVLLQGNIADVTKKAPQNSKPKEKKITKQNSVPRRKKATEKSLEVEELQLDNTPANGNEDAWTLEQIHCLKKGWMDIPHQISNFWQQVADQVPGRNAAECYAKICEQYPAKGGKSAKRPPIDLPGPRKKQHIASEKEEAPKIDQDESEYRTSRSKVSREQNDAADEDHTKKQQIDQILQQRRGLSLANRNQKGFMKSNVSSLERPHTTDIRQIHATIAAAAKEFEIQGTDNRQSQPDVYYWDTGVQFEIE